MSEQDHSRQPPNRPEEALREVQEMRQRVAKGRAELKEIRRKIHPPPDEPTSPSPRKAP